MPTATPFTALGRGNGFPFCPTRVNVSSLPSNDIWTTLSGWNSSSIGTPSQASIDESRRLAMKLFWNGYSISGNSSYSSKSLSASFPLSYDNPNNTYGAFGIDFGGRNGPYDPFERVCYTHTKIFDNVDDGDPLYPTIIASSITTKPVALHSAFPATAENLLGYAVGENSLGISTTGGAMACSTLYSADQFGVPIFTLAELRVGYRSFQPTGNNGLDSAFVTMSGDGDTFYLCCDAFSGSGGGASPSTISISNNSNTINMSFTGLGFYTYA